MRTRVDDSTMPVTVVTASDQDLGGWLRLAAEMEPTFGPMASEPGFHDALRRAIGRGMAFCVRDWNGPPGCSLLGGVLVSASPGRSKIGWLAVTRRARRRGIGRALVQRALDVIGPQESVTVTTFAGGDPDGKPARWLYRRMGFMPAEAGPVNPAGRRTQVLRRHPQQ